MKRLMIPVLLLVVAAAGLFAWRPWRAKDDNRILLSGNIEMTEVDISFKAPGKLLERNYDEGDTVAKNAVVARLDRDALVQQRAQAEASIAVGQAQLAQSQTSVGLGRETVAADVQQRKADLEAQQARLAELRNGSRPEEIRQAAAAVESAQAEYDRAQRDLQRAEVLHKNDDISTQQYDQFRQRALASDAQLKQTKQQQALVQQGPRREQLEQAAANVERSRAAIRLSEANTLDVRRREQDVTARRADIVRLRALLGQIDVQLEDTIARSPVAGIVLVKSADPGEVIAAGTPVVTIGDIDHPWVRGYLRETDLGRVKLGMQVKVTTDSYPGKAYDGKLTFISSQAEFTPRQIQTHEERVKLVYRVKVEIDNRNHELKSNMPVDAEISVQ